MRKSFLTVLMCTLVLGSFCMTGCEQKAPAEQATKQEQNTTAEEKKNSEMMELPPYKYTGDDAAEAAITEYMLAEAEESYDIQENEVVIPAFMFLRTEEGLNGSIRVYGNFWTMSYTAKDGILECQSGGENPGVFYLKKHGDRYDVDAFEAFGDGSEYEKDLNRICKGIPGLKRKYLGCTDMGTKKNQDIRTRYIATYVKENQLDIKAYKDYGWDPIELPN